MERLHHHSRTPLFLAIPTPSKMVGRFLGRWNSDPRPHRRGAFIVLTAFCLAACFAFVSLAIDIGFLVLTRTKMQNATDAAALAAAQEITNAIQTAPVGTEDITVFAENSSRDVARRVAELNNTYVDRNLDVTFGQRKFDEASGKYLVTWDVHPANVVKVVARRDNEDATAPDGKLALFFAGVVGSNFAKVRTESVAYVESRDIVVVHDFSRSMNFDSYFNNEANARLSPSQIVQNLNTVWNDLNISLGNMAFTPQYLTLSDTTENVTGTVTFKYDDCSVTSTGNLIKVKVRYTDGNEETFPASGQAAEISGSRDIETVWMTTKGTGPDVVQQFNDTNANVRQAFELTGSYPYPGGSWNSFINHCRNGSELQGQGYQEMYGGLTWTDYTLRYESGHWETPDLWKTRHYPFHSIKEGHMLFCDFLNDLNFGDELGMVSYDTHHRREDYLNDSDPSIPTVDISADPISDNYAALKNMMLYKQAAHYSYATNMGGGLEDAILLLNEEKRIGARPTILLMTDGNTNTIDSGTDTSLPAGWNWDELFDYDGDGNSDYSTGSSQKKYVLRLASEAVAADYTIHTMAVGIDADRDLMRAIAHIAKGHFIDVPGGTSVNDMTADVEEAFHRIASFVPPAKLMSSEQ